MRVYVGCSSVLYGDFKEADIVKIHKWTGKVSLMFYDNFWRKAHPELQLRIKILLRTQELEIYDYARNVDHTQLLYEKETYLDPDHPKYRLFSQLTAKERAAGLLDFEGLWPPDLDQWNKLLSLRVYKIREHRLIEATV